MWTDPVESVTRPSGGRGREKPIDRLRRTARSSNMPTSVWSHSAQIGSSTVSLSGMSSKRSTMVDGISIARDRKNGVEKNARIDVLL